MPRDGNKKTPKNTPNKTSKENTTVITMEKIEEMPEQEIKSYKENIKSYPAANNELLSKRMNELNDKLNDLQASIEHSNKVNAKSNEPTAYLKKRSHNKDKPRTTVFKLHSSGDKESILRNVYLLKYTGYCINEDFSNATLNIMAELWGKVKRLRGEGYYAVIKYGSIVTNKRDEVARE